MLDKLIYKLFINILLIGNIFAIEVLVPEYDIVKGSVFNINDLIIINTDKNNIDDINYLVDINYSTFLVAKKTLKQYQPIRIKDIKKQALILKGQVITAILKKKNLTIEIQGIAMEDGAQSEIIKIKTKNKILNAKIINDHYVALVI